LLLGYLDPEFFLGGRLRLDPEAAERAIQGKIGEPLGMSAMRAAWGIHQLVNEGMASAARVHAIERGKDPRSLPLFAFGGAGPGHAFGVGRILHSPRMLVPFGAGVTSAIGFLTAPLAFDFVRSYLRELSDSADWEHINALFADMQSQGDAILARSGVPISDRRFTREADLRYAGQGHEIRVPLPEGELGPGSIAPIRAVFEDRYRALFGRTGPEVPLEGVSWRLLASGPQPSVTLRADSGSAADALKGERPVYFAEWSEHRPTRVYDRYALAPGAAFEGPAIIEERESTTVVGPGARIEVDEARNLSVWL
jgi:N-methylhydantoinase A